MCYIFCEVFVSSCISSGAIDLNDSISDLQARVARGDGLSKDYFWKGDVEMKAGNNGKVDANSIQKVTGLLAEGASCASVAAAVGASRQSAYRWKRKFEAAGVDGLMVIGRKGRPPRLTTDQIATLKFALAQSPSKFGENGDTWSLKKVARYISVAFHVSYEDSNVSRLLISMGLDVKTLRQRVD